MSIHLEIHSYYTLLGSTIALEDLVAQAAAEGISQLPLTDTNALYGVVAFDRVCQAAEIQALVGMTVTVSQDEGGFGGENRLGERAGQLVLLSMGPSGYRSLCRLSSLIQGQPTRELLAARGLNWGDLESHNQGLLCLSGGRLGWLNRFLQYGDEGAAFKYATRLASIFGERAYLSLELHSPADHEVAQAIQAFGQRLGLPSVAVQPVYTLKRQEKSRLRLLAAIDHNCLLDQVPSAALPSLGDPAVDLHWLSSDEMARRFASYPQALTQVEAVISRCRPALPDGSPIWPVLKLPEGQRPEEALTTLVRAGMQTHYGSKADPEPAQRLAKELKAITRYGYAPLFLIVADIVRFARQANIPVSTRGSVANSLVAYCAGITTVDPVEHGLLFERFLNPARSDPPDIDLDFCSRRRDQVLDYVRRTYGQDQVALVATISTMRLKSALRETAKAHGLNETQIKQLVLHLPRHWHPDPQRRQRFTLDDLLAAVSDDTLGEVVRLAYELVGQPHHLSVHPGGVVITPGLMTDIVAVQWAPKGFLVTQLNHKDVAGLGLPKLDLLGISALTVLADATERVRERHEAGFSPHNVALDDPSTQVLLSRGDTVGVFQCESEGARQTLRKLKAKTVRDLAVANAFFKPGPATGGMARQFVRRYRGEVSSTFLHPALAPILGPTQGVLIFQEQILEVARDIAGLSWAEANQLRTGISKFKREAVMQLKQRFVEGCQRAAPAGPGFKLKQAEMLWQQVEAFAGYGFNQGHATAYADLSYRLAYLKAHFPAEFLEARLINRGGFHSPAIYMAEARRLGISVEGPHVNYSQAHFSLVYEYNPKGTLYMGLGRVRDLRWGTIQALISARKERPFSTLFDLLGRVTLQSKEIRHLIQGGALDGLGPSRAALLDEVEHTGQGKGIMQMALPFERPTVPAESVGQRLAWEMAILGMPVSDHPLANVVANVVTNVVANVVANVAEQLPEVVPLCDVANYAGQVVTVAGVRLPGRTGVEGFYVDDGSTFVLVRLAKALKSPAPWQPVSLRGRWVSDEFGTGWLQVEAVEG